jgi:RES domain-containing protein
VEVYRLTKTRYATQLSGEGASVFGGRWNLPGTKVIYTAENRSLALVEVLVHLQLTGIPDEYCMVTIHFPDILPVVAISVDQIHADWDVFPNTSHTQKLTDHYFHEMDFAAVRVPSAITKGEYNLLLNPLHPQFNTISIKEVQPFEFDRRLFKR